MINEMKIVETRKRVDNVKYEIIGHNLLFMKHASVNTEASLARI